MIRHRVETLKNISQHAHTLCVSLQYVEQVCSDALACLSPTFNLWGPYTQFLERLIMLIAKKPNFPNKIITIKESMEIVKELIGFFTRKVKIIQGKIKVLS